MTVPFKFLPYGILNKPKPALAIRIFPQAPHEFFTLKPTEKLATPLKPVTTICACLWSQNPQPTKKKKKKKEMWPTQAHQPPKPTNQHLAAGDPSSTYRRHHHRRWGRRPPPCLAATVFLVDVGAPIIAPPPSSIPSTASPSPVSFSFYGLSF